VDPGQGWEAWTTKDRLGLGWHAFHHRLVFHDGDWKAEDICGESDRLRLPLQAIKPLGPAPDVVASGDQSAGLWLSPASVRISAFYEAPEGFVLRIYESSGEDTEALVSLPASFASAQRTDFNLQPVEGDVHLDGDALRVRLRKWEIATVMLRR